MWPLARLAVSRSAVSGCPEKQQYFAIRALLLHFNCQFNPRQHGHRYFRNEEVRGIIPSGLDSLKGLEWKKLASKP